MSAQFSVGQMNQLGDAMEAAGFTPEMVTKLHNTNWSLIESVLVGTHEIVPIDLIVDLDADPFVPEGWSVPDGNHIKGGKFRFDPAEVALHLDDEQKNGMIVVGTALRPKLQNLPVFNANLLDWLLTHPQFIPEEWKSKSVFFWGTIYRYSDGCLYVRSLRWYGGGWGWRFYWLDYTFSDRNPAAVRASA